MDTVDEEEHDRYSNLIRVFGDLNNVPTNHNTTSFQTFIIDKLSQIQQQNLELQNQLSQIQKEQETYYLESQMKLQIGSNDTERCIQEVRAMKEVFKEIVGIMSGERIRIVSSSENNNNEDYQSNIQNSTLLAENDSKERLRKRNTFQCEREIISGSSLIKTEEDQEEGGILGSSADNTIERTPEHCDRSFKGTTSNYNTENQVGVNGDINQNYKINRSVRNVPELACEYFEGFPGKPSMLYLERRYGSHWRRNSKDRTLFSKRMCIINKIKEIHQYPCRYNLPENISRNTAIRVVENVRLGNNNFKGRSSLLSISQLYLYFSKKMDKIADYSLTLNNRPNTRRFYLMREREHKLEDAKRDINSN